MFRLLPSLIFAAAITAAPAAYAVDVENQDDADHEISVVIGEAMPVTFLLKAGEKKANVCGGQPCVLIMNEIAVEAEEDDQLVVRDGELISQTRG